jgi:hypothetical protein
VYLYTEAPPKRGYMLYEILCAQNGVFGIQVILDFFQEYAGANDMT